MKILTGSCGSRPGRGARVANYRRFVGASAFVWAVVYAELGSAYPYAGGDYVGVGSILGPWAGIASLTVWAVTQGPIIAFLAKTIAIYVSDLSPAAPPTIVTFAGLGAATAIALLAVRLALAFGIADPLDADAGRPSLLLLGALIGAGLLWRHLVLRRRAGG